MLNTDVVVVGAGVAGLAVTATAAATGADVLCVEAAHVGAGQSLGAARNFRHLHTSQAQIRLAADARLAWRSWEEQAGRRLLYSQGIVMFSGRPHDDLARLQAADVEAELVPARSSDLNLPTTASWPIEGVKDVQGGTIDAAETLKFLASKVGTRLMTAMVRGLVVRPEGVVVETSVGRIRAGRVIVCAGDQTSQIARVTHGPLPERRTLALRLAFPLRDGNGGGGLLGALMDSSETFGDAVYGGPTLDGTAYVLGLSGVGADVPIATDSEYLDPRDSIDDCQDRLVAYVRAGLDGLLPTPTGEVMGTITSIAGEDDDAVAVWCAPSVAYLLGNNLFKLAPVLGSLVWEEALSGGHGPFGRVL